MIDYSDPNNLSLGFPSVPYASPSNYAPYFTAAGGGFAAASQFIAGKQSASLLRANAGIARLQATSEVQAGAEQADLYRQHLNQTVGKQIAAVGGSGLSMSGSPLRALESTAYLGAQDVARIQTNAARRAWGFQVTAAGDEVRADQASSAGTANALGGLITTGARAYSQWTAD